MRTYERNGIHVDQCTECRGLFLDRGELEHLVQAEGSFYGGESAPRREEPPMGRAERTDGIFNGQCGCVIGRMRRRDGRRRPTC